MEKVRHFIVPKRLNVGYNKKSNTTNGLLGYVIYYDLKTGELRKEKSQDSWRDKSIKSMDFDNVPMKGFLFSSNIVRGGYYRGVVEKIRVFDPRGFDVEISIENLMKIIEHYTIEKAEINGKLAYTWYGNELLLLPIDSSEYKESLDLSLKSEKNYTIKDLIVGNIYQCKKSKSVFNEIYLGRFDVNCSITSSSVVRDNEIYLVNNHRNIGKRHIFLRYDDNRFIEKYTIANPKMILSESGKLSDEELNNKIMKFEDSIYTKRFDGVVYLNKMKKLNLNKDNHKDSFTPFFKTYKSLAKYKSFAIDASKLFGVDGINFNYDYRFNNRIKEDEDKIFNALMKDLDIENQSPKSLAIKFLDLLSDKFEGELKDPHLSSRSFFYSSESSRNVNYNSSNFIYNKFSLSCYFFSVFMAYYATVNGTDTSLDVFESNEFREFSDSIAIEIMNQLDFVYLTAMRDTNGDFFIRNYDNQTIDDIEKSYEVANINEDNILIWSDKVNDYFNGDCTIDQSMNLSLKNVIDLYDAVRS